METLGGKKAKRGNVRYRQSTTFQCVKCEFAAKTSCGLEKHKKKDHALSFLATSISSSNDTLGNAITSTRDNSMIQILNEDISELNLLDDSSGLNDKNTIEEIAQGIYSVVDLQEFEITK